MSQEPDELRTFFFVPPGSDRCSICGEKINRPNRSVEHMGDRAYPVVVCYTCSGERRRIGIPVNAGAVQAAERRYHGARYAD